MTGKDYLSINQTRARSYTNIAELEKMARKSKNPTILHTIVQENFENRVICAYVAENRYADSETLGELAKHYDPNIRLKVAQRSADITASKTLVRLALDSYHPVKVALSKSVKNDGIKRLLLKNNLNDRIIVGNCLRRTADMELVTNFILESSEERIKTYVTDILQNRNLTEIAVQTLLITCAEISDSEVISLKEYVHSPGFTTILPDVVRYVDAYISNHYIDSGD